VGADRTKDCALNRSALRPDPLHGDHVLDAFELAIPGQYRRAESHGGRRRECVRVRKCVRGFDTGCVQHIIERISDDLHRKRFEVIENALGVVQGSVPSDDVVDLTHVDLVDEQGRVGVDGCAEVFSDRRGAFLVVEERQDRV